MIYTPENVGARVSPEFEMLKTLSLSNQKELKVKSAAIKMACEPEKTSN
jgi:hypothetical protein